MSANTISWKRLLVVLIFLANGFIFPATSAHAQGDVPAMFKQYGFTYHYGAGSGDYYTGILYARADVLPNPSVSDPIRNDGYNVGFTQWNINRDGTMGYYEINWEIIFPTGYDVGEEKRGDVVVNSYYDAESGITYTPIHCSSVIGTEYLGSEHDYIITDGVNEYLFGSSGGFFEEADLTAYAYDFKFTYGNGDYYTGTMYAEPEKGYSTSYTQTTTDENGQTGSYVITEATGGYDVGQAGQVYVNSYYDQESGNTYIPMGNGTMVGAGYLGSEHDYILLAGVPEYLFGSSGGTFYEADLAVHAYDFKFSYGNGDYYTGTVYAEPWKGYSTAYTQTVVDENSLTGAYAITKETTGYDVGQAGRVYVNSYYDQESGNTYVPMSNGTMVGAGYLGSEHDYIIQAGVLEYLFGSSGVFHEADLTGYAYDFRFTYGNGDYYTGKVYAAPEKGYSAAGYTQTVTDEYGRTGAYAITGVTTGYDVGQAGQVYVDSYYDQESGNIYPPVTSGTAVGAGYLGSEHDYILQAGTPGYLFGSSGGVFYEADLPVNAYVFTFSYGNGDYYTGTMYADPVMGYSVGGTQTTTDENGQTGTYEITGTITGVDAGGSGQVLISSYYDAESGKSFTPLGNGGVLGADYLGSEHGYIIKDGVSEYYFGEGQYEADLVTGGVNTFRLSYANGDYYTGTVYADPAAYRYYLGYTQTVTDENGQPATYEVTAVAPGTATDPRYGSVYVTGYFDAETGQTYTPTVIGNPLGTNYLGSEAGYILKSKIDYLRFGFSGGVFWEADVAALYNFTFHYGNGDFYQGTVYSAAGYPVGYKKYQDDETTFQTGVQGYYEITGASYVGYNKKYRLGQVSVGWYYDAESQMTWKPVAKAKPPVFLGAVGSDNLGSEYYYIIKRNIGKFYFGGGYYEADVY